MKPKTVKSFLKMCLEISYTNRGTADRSYSLVKEAINYLQRLKGTAKDNELMRKIENIKYGHRAK